MYSVQHCAELQLEAGEWSEEERAEEARQRRRESQCWLTLQLLQAGPPPHSCMGQVVDKAVPASDEVHLPHDVPHLQPAQRLRDEVLAPERHLSVLIAPVSEAADDSGY